MYISIFLNNKTEVKLISYLNILSAYVATDVNGHLCFLKKRPDLTTSGNVMTWSLPYRERCVCTKVLPVSDMHVPCPYQGPPGPAAADSEPYWWFTANPGPLTKKDNWTPATLDVLLDRVMLCGKYAVKGGDEFHPFIVLQQNQRLY